MDRVDDVGGSRLNWDTYDNGDGLTEFENSLLAMLDKGHYKYREGIVIQLHQGHRLSLFELPKPWLSAGIAS